MQHPTAPTRSRWPLWIFLAALAYAWFATQGLPLWDDDFTSWFAKIYDRSILSVAWEWISPISTQPQHWGFNERPLQMLIYKLLHAVFGYRAAAYYLFKDLAYAGAGTLVYLWGLRLIPKDFPETLKTREWAALGAAAFFVLAPGPMASLVLYADYAPVAEVIFLGLSYVMWDWVEQTPAEWSGLPKLADPAQRRWLLRWSGLAGLTYLGYKSKADLKLLPAILGAYVFAVRRRQLGYFAVPIGLMALLAVPWGGAAFQKLPAFLPGSQGSEVAWMWQPPSWERFREFFWSSQNWDFWTTVREPSLSLASTLGALLLPLLVFLGWRMEAFDRVPWRRLDRREDRARLFALIWLLAIFAAISVLAAINYTFRIRYGILPLVPLSLLLAWVFGLIGAAGEGKSPRRLAPWAACALAGLLILQCLLNLQRSLRYRHDMGVVMISVDQAYEAVADRFGADREARLALLPDFRPYDYYPEGPALFQGKKWLADGADLVKEHFPEGRTAVVSWHPSLWDRLEIVDHFTGCRATTPFDWLWPCVPATGTWLMRFVPADPDYAKGEELRAHGDVAGARRLHEGFLARHPANAAGYFVVGLEAYQMGDFARTEQTYGWLQERFPDHPSILYNRALALEGLHRPGDAAPLLQSIADREPRNLPVLQHLAGDYRDSGQKGRAREVALGMKREFPANPEVDQLLNTVN